MPSNIVPFKGVPSPATKYDHLDPIDPTLKWKKAILLILLGVLAYIIAGHFFGWCEAHLQLILCASLGTLSTIVLWNWLGRVPPHDLCQNCWPSNGRGW